MLRPHMNFLIYKICFPAVCLTPEGIALFDCDPHELVHYQNYLIYDFYDPRMTAITLITDLVKHCGKEVTQVLLGFLIYIMIHYVCSSCVFSLNISSLIRNLSRTYRGWWLHLYT